MADNRLSHVCAAGAVTVIAVGLIAAVPTASPLPNTQLRTVHLTGVDTADSPLGDGVALVMGPSGVPLTAPSYLEAVDKLYLEPRGFTGTVQGVPTPEGLNPITGPKSLTFDTSEAQGQKILDTDILQQIHDGHVSAENPVVVFGYSQSAVISAQLMQELHDQGVPSDYVHFIMVADESIPNGGSLSSFDLPIGAHPSAPSLGLTMSGAQPNDLYPTDVYTQEYDGFADFPRYPLDELSTLNALIGILTQHIIYTSLPESDIADAIQLPTTAADTLTNYYMIPTEQLPLLEPLLLFGSGGKALYDLLEPDMRILVDLGYGSLTEGWNQGPADVATPLGFLPNINLGDLFTALADGAKKGFTDFTADLQHPEPPAPSGSLITDNPVLATIIDGFRTWGVDLPAHPTLIDFGKALLENFTGYPVSDATLGSSSLTDIVNSISGTISGDIANLTPFADTANALLTSLPAAALNLLTDSFEAGHPLQGIEEALGAFGGLVPFALFYGAGVPLANELGGTLINLADLVGLGDLQL